MVLQKYDYWIHDPLNNISEKLKIFLPNPSLDFPLFDENYIWWNKM